MHIPSTGEQVELRLNVDDSGLLYLETLVAGRDAYSLPGVISLGWKSWTSRRRAGVASRARREHRVVADRTRRHRPL
jgi:hypothetical protein